MVTVATSDALFIFSQSLGSIPSELDEPAEIGGASLGQIYWGSSCR